MAGATKAGEKAILDAWHSFGKFIGAHMAPIAVACVVAACAFPAQLSHLAPAVPWLFALVSFQGALTNKLRNLAQAVSRPVPMLLTIAFASGVMPVVAFLLAKALFGSNIHLVTGIVLEYSVPVAAISTMWISMFGGNVAEGLATLMVSSVLAPVTIPATLQVLLGHAVHVDAGPMMLNVILTVALPAVLGMGLNDVTHGWAARRFSPDLMPAARVAIVLVIASNATSAAPYLTNLTPRLVGVLVFILLFASTGYLAGLALARVAGQDVPGTVSMVFQCGMRNISCGAVIAAQFFPPAVMFPVVAGTLFQQVLAAAYGKVMGRVLGVRPDAPAPGDAASAASATSAPTAPAAH